MTPTVLTTYQNNANTTSYTTSAYDVAADTLVFAAVQGARTAGVPTPTVAGNGLTWELVAGILTPGDTEGIFLYRSVGAAPTNGALTATFSATVLHALIIVFEISGTVITTNGADAIIQTDTDSTTATNLAAALAAFASPDNGTLGVWFQRGETDPDLITFAAPMAEVDQEFIVGGEDAAMGVGFYDGEDTTPSASWAASVRCAVIAAEIGAPIVPPSGGGNRMGGTGAIRKPPRPTRR